MVLPLRFCLLWGWCLGCALAGRAAEAAPPGRERLSLDAGWRFALGHATDPAQDFGHGTGYFSYLAKTGYGDGPASPHFDDRAWRTIRVPHDWGVELPFDPRGQASHGFKALGRGFPATSVGWYRRTFPIPASDLGRRISLELDGVYRAARVFVNGFFVGEEPSGYLPARYNLTEYLHYGGDNVVAVRVDATMPEGWYYEGAGIYRHVWLTKTAPLHLAPDSVWVRTELSADGARATLRLEAAVSNEGRDAAAYELALAVLDPAGQTVATATVRPDGPLAAGATTTHAATVEIARPRPWSPEDPALHTVVATLRPAEAGAGDRTETRFGIRTVRFDPAAGFFLNGRHVVLKGTNNHQDHAGVGVALPDALQEFRLRQLLAMGSNTYRTAHHPPTPELLEACDRLGLLVIDEHRLMGANAYHLGQLERLVRRDRHHPSVILWSIGNEEWAVEGNVTGARLTVPMQDLVHRLDPSRPVTAAISGGWGGVSSAIQVAGVNYVRQADVDRQHREAPWQAILGTEETTTQQTRGVYFDEPARAWLAPQEDGSSGGNAESGWRFYAARPFAAGVVYWTGFDYRGEPTPFGWPAIASQFGILDTCGFPKDGFHYLRAWWTDAPVLHVFPHWNWPGREGQVIEVKVHTNCDEVELWLNGASLGRQRVERHHSPVWRVPYAPGALVARGYRGGREVLAATHATTGAPARLTLAPDRRALAADGADATPVAVEVRDAAGRLVPTGGVPVTFALRGPGRIIGVGNGDPSSHEPDVVTDTVRTVPLGVWQAPDAAVRGGELVFEAVFDRPALAEGEAAALLLNALGPRQTVTLNGEVWRGGVEPAAWRAPVDLAGVALRPTGNVLRVVAPERHPEWRDREGLRQVHPAVVRIVRPAPPWARTTFHGLAQVIVQATGEPGRIVLEATSPGLGSAVVELTATPSP